MPSKSQWVELVLQVPQDYDGWSAHFDNCPTCNSKTFTFCKVAELY
jgi:hypothetical protein